MVYVPLRMHGGYRLVFHPRGKAFVEPDVIPPLHGHQIAEPLVSHLVGDGQGYLFLRVNGGRFGVDQQRGLTKGDGAEVFHGAGLEVGQGDQVELFERVRNAKVVVVVVQHVFGDIYAVRRERDFVGRGAGAYGHAVGFARGALEIADQEGHQVGGHFRRGGKFERVLAGCRAGGVADDLPVGDGYVPCIHHQRSVVGGLKGWLIERRKGAPRVGGLELGDSVVALGGLRQIEAAQLVVQNAGVMDGQRGLARGQCHGESKCRLLFVLVERDSSLLLFAVSGHAHTLKGDLGGVQRDVIRRFGKVHIDKLFAGEGCGLEVGRKGEFVVLRADSLWQPLGVQ